MARVRVWRGAGRGVAAVSFFWRAASALVGLVAGFAGGAGEGFLEEEAADRVVRAVVVVLLEALEFVGSGEGSSRRMLSREELEFVKMADAGRDEDSPAETSLDVFNFFWGDGPDLVAWVRGRGAASFV